MAKTLSAGGRRAEASAPDPTRGKLIEAAGRVFAERGYHAATVREICSRARANVAAVNYHFKDKLGLYTEVLLQSVRAAQFERVLSAAGRNAPPEEILRGVIRERLQGLCGEHPRDWHIRIVAHELADPTPAMSRVIDEAMRPLHNRMREIVGRMLGLPPDAEKTRLCVLSVMGQVILYALAQPVLVQLWPGLKTTRAQMDRIAEHIAEFSLAYLREAGRARRRK